MAIYSSVFTHLYMHITQNCAVESDRADDVSMDADPNSHLLRHAPKVMKVKQNLFARSKSLSLQRLHSARSNQSSYGPCLLASPYVSITAKYITPKLQLLAFLGVAEELPAV